MASEAKITKADARELKSVVRMRFDLLRTETSLRETELRQLVREQVIRENQERIDEYRDRVRALADEALALSRRLTDLADEAYQNGLHISGSIIVVNTEQWNVLPKNLDYEVQRRIQEVYTQSHATRLGIDRQEVELLEKLTLQVLDSNQAREFIESIPTVDELIPLPNGDLRKAIEERQEQQREQRGRR